MTSNRKSQLARPNARGPSAYAFTSFADTDTRTMVRREFEDFDTTYRLLTIVLVATATLLVLYGLA